MLSSKTVFLGVYTTNGILRLLFLPICSLFILSPFSLLALRYSGLGWRLLNHIPEDYKTPDTWPQIFIALITVLLATRLLSGRNGAGTVDGKRRVQLLPFWVPGVRHWWNFVFGGEKWLKNIRDTSISSIIAYNYSGTKHNVVLSAPLLDIISGNLDALDEAKTTKWMISRNAYGLPQNCKDLYLQLRPAIMETFENEIFSGQQLKTITSAFTRNLSEALPDLITFNSSIVDQLPWERVAGVELTDGTDEVECEFFTLINEFFCNAMIPLITGSQFTESYELLGSDLMVLNQHFYAVALGLPRLFPLPGLPSASLAKKRLLRNLERVINDISNPPVKRVLQDDESVSGEETDADTPTPLTALNDLFTTHHLPLSARAAITLELLHRLTSKAVPLAFWTIFHIYQQSTSATKKAEEQTPLASIRKETQTWAEAVQPPSIHPSFPAPPEISFSSISPLFNPSALTYLRSCVFESRRLYTSSITTAKITKPIIFTDTAVPGSDEQWQLDAGSYIDIGLSQRLINTSPAEYLTPYEYKPGRFANVQSPAPLASTLFDDSEELVTAMVLAFVAGVTQLWDIDAAPKQTFFEQMQEAQAMAAGEDMNKVVEARGKKKKPVWVVPKTIDGASVMVPARDIKVRIRRREKLPSKTMKDRT